MSNPPNRPCATKRTHHIPSHQRLRSLCQPASGRSARLAWAGRKHEPEPSFRRPASSKPAAWNSALSSTRCRGRAGRRFSRLDAPERRAKFPPVTNALIALLSTLLATNAPVLPRSGPVEASAPAGRLTATNDPTEREFRALLEMDDNTQEEVDRMIREEEAFEAAGAKSPTGTLRDRIFARFAPVRRAYEDFLRRHPDHARARLAYGSFLNDLKDEEGAREQWELARKLDPKNPAAWNNLANYHGHRGPVTNAFDYYARAIELEPNEPVYYQNLGTTVYLFRKDAMAHFRLTEQEVFDKALDLYARALRLDPTNFTLATDIAQTFYGITPLRTNEALLAWSYALKLARDDIEREGVRVHLARVNAQAGRFEEARAQLAAVTNSLYADLKQRVLRSLEAKEAAARDTNRLTAAVGPTNAPASPAERAACSSLVLLKQPTARALEAIAELGYRWVDLSALKWAPHVSVTNLVQDFEVEATRIERLLATNRLRVANLTFEPVESCEFSQYEREFEALARLAARLQARLINLMAPSVKADRAEQVEKLRRLVAIAKRHGILLTVETHVGQITEQPARAAALCREIPGLGLTLDPSHYFAGPNQGAPFEEVLPFVQGTGFRAGGRTWQEIQLPWGEGPIDFAALVRRLEAEGYRGFYVCEYLEGFNQLDPLAEARKFLAWIRTL